VPTVDAHFTYPLLFWIVFSQINFVTISFTSIFARANATGHIRSKRLILSNLNYFIKIQSKTYFCGSKKFKRCMFKKHKYTFTANVRIQSRFIKKSYKMTKITKFFILIFFKKIEEILTIEIKGTFGIYMHPIFFEQSKYIFMSSHGLHYIFPPSPACTKDIVHIHYK
jgi:hypothetical protein